MSRRFSNPGSATILLVLAFFLPAAAGASTPEVPKLARVVTHDNTHAAGQLKDGVLTLHLEIKEGEWHPDADNAPGVPALAFAEEGGPASVPGPMIRVPQGTRIHLFLKNPLQFPVVFYGFHQRPGDAKDAITLAPDEVKEVDFLAGAPGTYFYRATCFVPIALDAVNTSDTTLTGAFIVDAPGAPVDDKVMVIGLWYTWLVPFDFDRGFHEILTMNGKSWPHTTRMAYTVGETAHWRVINASVAIHPMHLHGAHFRVDSAGDGERDSILAPGLQRMVVTESMQPGRTMAMTWTPTHAGNWIFHCHLAVHFSAHLARNAGEVMNVAAPSEHHDHASGMAGLIVGIEVKPRAHEVEAKARPAERQLTLTIGRTPAAGPEKRRCITMELRDGASLQTTAPGSELGPTIVVYRNQPTEIKVVNNLSSPTAIHWHGIELESYYDGVPGYGGDSRQTTPEIADGQSFTAHMTPPRAGTYIYHTHWHDVDQLTTGLYGALIVLEPGQKYEPEHDRVFVVSRGAPKLDSRDLLVNGSATPASTQFRSGEKYRLRFINITPSDDEVQFSLLDQKKPAMWTPLAKDGADLAEPYRKSCEARQKFAAGETYDYIFQPATAGKLELETTFGRDRTVMALDVVELPKVSRN